MKYELSEVTLIIGMGTVLFLALAAFIAVLLFLYKRKYLSYQAELALLYEKHQREILTAQLETQNQTLQQVAGDLHDHVGQMLAVVWLHLNRLHKDLEHSPHKASVTELLSHTATLVTDVRSLSKSLSTDTVTRFGLRACLDLELDRINRAQSLSQAVMTVLGDAYSMGHQTEIILLRMVQEALNNALKHAPGTAITLTLDYKEDRLMVTVTDQGPGFSMDAVEARALAGAGQGLYNLRRRANLLGGTCTWQSVSPEQGTSVVMVIPRINPIGEGSLTGKPKWQQMATV